MVHACNNEQLRCQTKSKNAAQSDKNELKHSTNTVFYKRSERQNEQVDRRNGKKRLDKKVE